MFKNFQSHFSCQLCDWRISHHTVSEAVIACFNRISRTNIVTIASTSLLAVACKVTSQSPLRWHSSDHRHHAVDHEFIRNPVSSYFHSQFFYAFEFTRTAMNSHFRSQVRLSCDVNSLAIARIAISTRNLRLSSLRLCLCPGEVISSG